MIEDWGQCSVTCGEGIETREILCKQEISSTLTVTVSEEACLTTLSPNLLRTRPCFRKPCADGSSLPIKPYWKTGTWSIVSFLYYSKMLILNLHHAKNYIQLRKKLRIALC